MKLLLKVLTYQFFKTFYLKKAAVTIVTNKAVSKIAVVNKAFEYFFNAVMLGCSEKLLVLKIVILKVRRSFTKLLN